MASSPREVLQESLVGEQFVLDATHRVRPVDRGEDEVLLADHSVEALFEVTEGLRYM